MIHVRIFGKEILVADNISQNIKLSKLHLF